MDVREFAESSAADPAAPLVLVAVGLDADRMHAPNEYVDLSRLSRGAEDAAHLRDELAAAGAGRR
jgi:acetylornithine deacetylase/succinyl-diaminopimelate desuccinylase-like protein